MFLKKWAKQQQISYWTALRWFHSGKLPVKAIQTETGSILVIEQDKNYLSSCVGVHLYARVSSHDQKQDLNRQAQRLRDYCASKGLSILSETSEIGSGLNAERKGLAKLLKKEAGDIVVEHKDRLARFGVPYIEEALKARGRNLIVMNHTESSQDLVQDFVDVVTCMCARIYGKRSASNKAKKALEATQQE